MRFAVNKYTNDIMSLTLLIVFIFFTKNIINCVYIYYKVY